MSKRASTTSDSSTSASKRTKSISDDSTPAAVESVSHDWLENTDPAELEKLLVEGAKLSPEFNALLAKAINKDAAMYEGEGGIVDFKNDVAELSGLIRNWHEGENWPEIVEAVEGINCDAKAPLLTKLNALRALASVIGDIEREMAGQYAEFAEGEEPDQMWKNLRKILETMTDDQRRTQIDTRLVKTLDNVITTKGTRSMYGKKGRNVGQDETDDEDEDADGDEDEEEGDEDEE